MPRTTSTNRAPFLGSPLDFPLGLVQYNLGDVANVTLDGSNRVSQWNDLSGNGSHFIQTDPTFRPNRTSAGFNGKFGVVISNATNSFMTSSPTIAAGGTPHTILVAARATSAQPSIYQGIVAIGGGSANLQSSTIGADNSNKLWFGGPGLGAPVYDTVVSGTTYVLAKRSRNVGTTAFDQAAIDNVDKGNTPQVVGGIPYAISPANSAYLGRYYSGSTSGFWSVGLVAIWTRILNDAEIRSLMGWIKNFYSLSYSGNNRTAVSGRVAVSNRIVIA